MEDSPADADRWQRIRLLLEQTLERTASERATFLDRTCDDPQMRRELDSLIECAESDFSLDRLVGNFVADAFAVDRTTNLEDERLGAYRIERLIGRGGMGSVYEAVRDDGEFSKRVAVKVIRQSIATPETLRRFRAERQLLANIDHPNIAHLVDGGTTDDGLPYLVMEYVEGVPIDRYCDSRLLPIRTRIELLVTLCSAVQFAHERQVIHRDIKPDNVLVNHAGVPKLLDFGLAKLLDPDFLDQTLEQTESGLQLMTPSFASPEQVRGDPIGPASDVYSIGVLLYELLTGHRPYAVDVFLPDAIRESVCDTVPAPPSEVIDRIAERRGASGKTVRITPQSVSTLRETDPATLQEHLRGDLDAITLRTLAKAPEDRMPTAAHLAEVLQSCAEKLPKPLAGRVGAPVLREPPGKGVTEHEKAPGGLAMTNRTTAWGEQSSGSMSGPQRWGHLEILGKVGAGQFGTVFKCRDTVLDRVMALKLFHPKTAGHGVDASDEAVAKILREGQLLARVEHPNVVGVHGVDLREGVVGLWMEYIEGQTLAELLDSQGRFSAREAGNVGLDLCRALAAVHRQGVIHRDVKAQNILREEGGRIILMDFGAGKDLADSAGPDAGEIGTPLYSAPEVLLGQPASPSSDLYSLAVLMFRLVSGVFPVDASSIGELRKRHEAGQTTRLRDVRPDLPARFVRVVEKALEADPADRYATAGEFEQALESTLRAVDPKSTSGNESDLAALTPWQRLLSLVLPVDVVNGPFGGALSVLGVVLLLALGWAGLTTIQGLSGNEPAGLQIPMQPPGGLTPSLGFGPAVAISRDGKRFAYVADDGATTKLFVQDLADEPEPRALVGTEGARTPFFSPNGDWIGYFDEDDRWLKKISISGGGPVELALGGSFWGATWGSDGRIVFSSPEGHLVAVSDDGGTAEPMGGPQSGGYMYPTLLPDGDTVLVTMREEFGSFDDASIAAIPVGGGDPTVVVPSAYYAHYSPTGHLVYVQRDSVLAVPFDIDELEPTGNPVTVLEGVWTSSWTGYADFAFSDTGALIFIRGGRDARRALLVVVDREGTPVPVVETRGPFRVPRFSPDGQQVAVTITDDRVDIWRYDLLTKNPTRVTNHDAWDAYQVWHPTLEEMAFSTLRFGTEAIYRTDLRTLEIEEMVTSDNAAYPNSWSPDGRLLAYWEDDPDTGSDLWVHSIETGENREFLVTSNNELWPEFSPDGRYIAYHSNESGGGLDIYIRPYPEGRPSYRVSVGGGRVPRWGPDGKELFFMTEGRLMVASITTEPSFVVGSPEALFEGAYANAYDVAPDGQSFAMTLEMVEGDPQMSLYLMTRWFDELRHRVSEGQ